MSSTASPSTSTDSLTQDTHKRKMDPSDQEHDSEEDNQSGEEEQSGNGQQTSPSPSPSPPSPDPTHEDYTVTVATLKWLLAHPQSLFQEAQDVSSLSSSSSPSHGRPLRKYVMSLAHLVQRHHMKSNGCLSQEEGGGDGLIGFSRRETLKKAKLEKDALIRKVKTMDNQYLNQVELRQSRRTALNSLMEQHAQGTIHTQEQKQIMSDNNNNTTLTLSSVNHSNFISLPQSSSSSSLAIASTPSSLTPASVVIPVPSTLLSLSCAPDSSSEPMADFTNVLIQSSTTSSADTSPTLSKAFISKAGKSNAMNKMQFSQEGVHVNKELFEKSTEGHKESPKVQIEDEVEEEPAKQPAQEDEWKDFGPVLHSPRSCYSCKSRFFRLHKFYPLFCPPCARLNWSKRHATADLKGKIYILTGSRVKIGFCCGLKLLRCGATVICTSRFPKDTAKRYSLQSDFNVWKDRLHIYGLDLRDLQAVVAFCDIIIQSYTRLDGIINNAAQTVRRPVQYYKHLLPIELSKKEEFEEGVRNTIKGDSHSLINSQRGKILLQLQGNNTKSNHTINATSTTTDDASFTLLDTSSVSSSSSLAVPLTSALLSQFPVSVQDLSTDPSLFPEGKFDITGQQLDLRKINSWLLTADQVDPIELVEVFAINALSPFLLNSRLKSLMINTSGDKHIINVSAMEGKFYRHKSPYHPHTNMAKAALNMLTRTSAQDYARYRIYMVSADTGWINEESPNERAQAIAATGFQTPIDEEDAMARILDPLIDGHSKGINQYGKFFKDFKETEW